MNDRYKLSQFYKSNGAELPYISFQDLKNNSYEVRNLEAISMALDFPTASSKKTRKEIEDTWINTLPKLEKLKTLAVKHRLNQNFFEVICQLPNLERLYFFGSNVEDISSIAKLTKLQRLNLHSFTRLTDISPLSSLENLKVLSIDNCFKVKNYEIIGELTGLIGLELCGDTFAPKRLRLNSLKPYTTLKHLKHLDFSSASIIDGSYEYILEMKNLERFDLVAKMPQETREKIKSNHKNLKAGFFVDYDFENNKFYEGKNWYAE